ncbi:MAG: sigma-54-dependent transcriptional regulator, partial [Anaeromyxobacteraceae bacterium]
MIRALVIDDEPNIRATLALCLTQLGCFVAAAATGAAAVEALRARRFDLALLDLRLGAEDGLAVLPRLLALRPDLEVVVITAYSTVDSAVEAMRRGAKDYLPKPFSPAQIRQVVERTRERRAVDQRVASLGRELHDEAPVSRLDAASPRMRAALEMVRRAAGHDVSVLLRGEPGTGKGALTRALHDQSARRDGPFVVVSCAATPEERLTVDLFGGRGAADHDGKGALARADGGTLLLEVAGVLPVSVQAPLLRFLRERRFERAGETAAR